MLKRMDKQVVLAAAWTRAKPRKEFLVGHVPKSTIYLHKPPVNATYRYSLGAMVLGGLTYGGTVEL